MDPIISTQDESAWRLVSDIPFNGLPENAFSATSMHLTFTEYYRPLVQSGMLQGQDDQVFIQESVVSVHDFGKWIGDVDVQGCLSSLLLSRQAAEACKGNHQQKEYYLSQREKVLSIASWDDILELPQRDMVVRAHGSWIARLATTLIIVQLQKPGVIEKSQKPLASILLFPKHSCCLCLWTQMVEHGDLGHHDLHFGNSASTGPQRSTIVIF